MAINFKHTKVEHKEFFTKNSYKYKIVYRTVTYDGIKRDVIVGRLLPGEELSEFITNYNFNLNKLKI